jgi:hypothetical protein
MPEGDLATVLKEGTKRARGGEGGNCNHMPRTVI